MRVSRQIAFVSLVWSQVLRIPNGLVVQKHRVAMKQAQVCLDRVSALPKAEGYSMLCSSVATMYKQQHDAVSSVADLRREGDRTRADYAVLEKRAAGLEKEVAALEQQ